MTWIVLSAVAGLILAGCVLSAAASKANRGGATLIGGIVVVGWLAITAFCSFRTVPTAHIGVKSFLGKIDLESYVEEGGHFVEPWVTVTPAEALKRHYVSVGSKDQLETVVCSDDKQVEVRLTFGYSLNPTYTARVQRHFKPEQLDTLALTAANSATRNVFISLAAKDVYGGKVNVVDRLQQEFENRLGQQLHGLDAFAELPPEQLKTVFIVLPVQAENILPPQRVRVAMNENQAAVIELERQKTLTEVAQQSATRMEKEGQGLKNIISELPAGTSLAEAAALIRAVADMKRAKAVEQAVQDGKIPLIYLDGQGGGATVPQTPQVHAPQK